MPRTKNAKITDTPADAICIADVHLRGTTPECRDDDFMAAQDRKLARIAELQEEHKCPVLASGDILDKWKADPWLEAWAIERIKNWICIPGQHDLPSHSIEEYDRCSLNVLEAAGSVKVLKEGEKDVHWGKGFNVQGFPWKSSIDYELKAKHEPAVALIHHLVYADKEPFPSAAKAGGNAKSILKKLKGFDLVISGDNHQTFAYCTGNGTNSAIDDEDTSTSWGKPGARFGHSGGQLLLNPGSIMRTTSAQVDHIPSAFLWWAETNDIEQIILPYDKNIVSRKHLELIEKREARKEELVSNLQYGYKTGKSFTENIERILAANPQDGLTTDLVWDAAES